MSILEPSTLTGLALTFALVIGAGLWIWRQNTKPRRYSRERIGELTTYKGGQGTNQLMTRIVPRGR